MTLDLLTEQQAAARLNVPPSWLASQRKARLIPYTALGQRYVRYSEANLAEIIRRYQTAAKRGR